KTGFNPKSSFSLNFSSHLILFLTELIKPVAAIVEESKRKRFAATDESDRVAESVIGDPTDEERERERERRRRRDWSSNGCDV
ncbi:unnamed protein product, partial [Brassica oleracea var. botrytis]